MRASSSTLVALSITTASASLLLEASAVLGGIGGATATRQSNVMSIAAAPELLPMAASSSPSCALDSTGAFRDDDDDELVSSCSGP